MQLFKQIERINMLDKLVQQQRTGRPEEFAFRLGISVSRLYVILEELKSRGAPIMYSRESCSYFYQRAFSISILVILQDIEEQHSRTLTGGHNILENYFATTFFVE